MSQLQDHTLYLSIHSSVPTSPLSDLFPSPSVEVYIAANREDDEKEEEQGIHGRIRNRVELLIQFEVFTFNVGVVRRGR